MKIMHLGKTLSMWLNLKSKLCLMGDKFAIIIKKKINNNNNNSKTIIQCSTSFLILFSLSVVSASIVVIQRYNFSVLR